MVQLCLSFLLPDYHLPTPLAAPSQSPREAVDAVRALALEQLGGSVHGNEAPIEELDRPSVRQVS